MLLIAHIRDTYEKIDLEKSYPSLFELLWYSQLPCFDLMNITTKATQQHGTWKNALFDTGLNSWQINLILTSGMIKKCIWKSKRISCSAIFSMHPTDRGMCCSFNKHKADMIFKESRYQKQMMRMNLQDKMYSFEDSGVPDW